MKSFIIAVAAVFAVLLSLSLMGANEQNGIPISDNDSRLCAGLAGVANSLCYRVEELEKHFHGRERWFGKLAVQTATDWADNNIATPYQAISGNNTYGAGASDAAQVIGTADTPAITLMTKFDVHRIMIIDASETTTYKLRLVYGTGTKADAIAAGQYSTFMVRIDPAKGDDSGTPIDVMMPRGTAGSTQVWLECWNATDDATIDFYVGWHEYTF